MMMKKNQPDLKAINKLQCDWRKYVMVGYVIKEMVHVLAVHLSSYGCTWKVWRALEKLEKHSASPRASHYAPLMLSKLSACIHNSIDAR